MYPTFNGAQMKWSACKLMENNIGKGDSTDHRSFLFPTLTHYHTIPHFDALEIYSCGNHCEKRRNCL